MGCLGSRFDKRKDAAGNLWGVNIAFVGGEGHTSDNCPVDKVTYKYGAGKEMSEVFKTAKQACEDEEIAKKIANETHACIANELAWIAEKFGEPVDGKKDLVRDKYDLKDAKAQMTAVQEALVAAGFEKPAAEGAAAGGEEKKEGEEEKKDDAAEMEGGEEGEAGAEGMDAMMETAGDLYKDDAEDYSGFANLPKLLLAQCVKNPYFGDLIKSQIVKWEFEYVETTGMLGVPMPKIPTVPMPKVPGVPQDQFATVDVALVGAAGMIGASIDASEGDAKDIWWSGYADEDNLETLKEIAGAQGPIMFPGWISAWASEDEAKKDLGTGEDGCGTKVIFKTNAKVLSAVVCRHFVQRLNGKLDSFEEKDGIWMGSVTEVPFEADTIADWEKKKDAAPAAEGAAAEEKKDEEKKEGEEEEKKDDAAE